MSPFVAYVLAAAALGMGPVSTLLFGMDGYAVGYVDGLLTALATILVLYGRDRV